MSKKDKGEKKAAKKDKYAHLRKRGEYKIKDSEADIPRDMIQENDNAIDRFYRFTRFGRVNKKMQSYNTKRKLRL